MPFPSPGDLPNLGIKLRFPALQEDSLPSEPPRKPEKHSRTSYPMAGFTLASGHLALEGVPLPATTLQVSEVMALERGPQEIQRLSSHQLERQTGFPWRVEAPGPPWSQVASSSSDGWEHGRAPLPEAADPTVKRLEISGSDKAANALHGHLTHAQPLVSFCKSHLSNMALSLP